MVEAADSLEQVLARGWLRTTIGYVPAIHPAQIQRYIASARNWVTDRCETCEVCGCCICEVCGGYDFEKTS